MTRKHFEAIAFALKINDASRDLISDMASTLAQTNPRFDKARFIEASTSDNPGVCKCEHSEMKGH